jgi:hypothetical protein
MNLAKLKKYFQFVVQSEYSYDYIFINIENDATIFPESEEFAIKYDTTNLLQSKLKY